MNEENIINSATILNWSVIVGAMALLTIFTFFSLIKTQKILRERKLNDVKFFIENGLEQVFRLALVADHHNTALGCSLGVWKSQLKSLLQTISFERLILESVALEDEIKKSATIGGFSSLGISLSGFRQIRSELEILYQERSEREYNKLLNILRKEFLEWRDDMKGREANFQGTRGEVVTLKPVSKVNEKVQKTG